VDAGGDVYVSDGANMRVLKEDLADAPSLSFATTAVGSTSADSPQTVTVENVGNAALSFPIPSTGNDPSIAANFTLNSSGASACPLVSAGSSTASTLMAGASCQLPISFSPIAASALSGSLVLTDNNLNAAAPGYATQSIALSGTGIPAPSFTLGASPNSLTLVQGASGTSTLSVTKLNGFTGSVTLAASGLPSGVTAVFATNPTTGSSVLTLTANSAATTGTATLMIKGTSGSLTALTTIALTVNPAPSFTLKASPNSLTLVQGASGTSTLSVTKLNGFTGSVTLAASGLASGVTASFGTNPTTGSSVLKLTASASATTGTDTVTVKGTSGALTATTTIVLTVNPPPTFTLSVSPTSLTVTQGASGTPTITVTGQNGFIGSVSLTASGLPSGVTASFAANPASESSVLTLTASSTATIGTATVTIKGTSGSLTASTSIALTVGCTPTTITPYISINGGSTWTEESSTTVSSTSTVVDLGPKPVSGGSWSWTGPNKYTSTERQINSVPLTVGADSYVATYTNTSGCKSTQTFTINVK
jgi:hypothetical protein